MYRVMKVSNATLLNQGINFVIVDNDYNEIAFAKYPKHADMIKESLEHSRYDKEKLRSILTCIFLAMDEKNINDDGFVDLAKKFGESTGLGTLDIHNVVRLIRMVAK